MEKKKKRAEVYYAEETYSEVQTPAFSTGDFIVYPFLLVGRILAWSGRQLRSLTWLTWRTALGTARWCWRTMVPIPGALIGAAWRATRWTLRGTWGISAGFWRWITGQSGKPLYNDPNLEAIRRIETHYRRRARFITHVVIFAFTNVALWLDYASNWPYPDYYGPPSASISTTVFWGLLLAIHFIHFKISEAKDRAVEAAIERERAWQRDHQPYDDAYADDARHLHLSGDGELVDMTMNDAPSYNGKPKRRG
jgi:hypothetical protein